MMKRFLKKVRNNKISKRIGVAGLAFAMCASLFPYSIGTSGSDTVFAATNLIAGVNDTVLQTSASGSFGGEATMKDYITKGYTYTDQMTVEAYKGNRSASYDRNYDSTGGNSIDYLLQSVEWTDQKNGEALLSVAGMDSTDSVALYCFQTCLAHGLTPAVVRQNIKELASVYDRVDVLCVNGPTFWDEYANFGHSYNSTEETKTTGHRQSFAYSSTNLSGYTYCGINPVFSISSDSLSDADIDKYLQSLTWYAVGHYANNQLAAVGCYLFGDISYDTWGTGEGADNDYIVNTVNKLPYKATNPSSNKALYSGNPSTRGAEYKAYLQSVANKFSKYTEADIVNMPTAIYMSGDSCVDGSKCLSFSVLPDNDKDGISDIVYSFNADTSYTGKTKAYSYMDYSDYDAVIGHTSASNAGKTFVSGLGWSYDDTSSFLLPYSMNENLIRIIAENWCDNSDRRYIFMASVPDAPAPRWSTNAADNLGLIAEFRPDYVADNWNTMWSKAFNHPALSYAEWNKYAQDSGKNVAVANYKYSFLQAGARLPDKKLTFDIPIGDSWQIASDWYSQPNIVYTMQYPSWHSKAGEYITKDPNGKLLVATISTDNQNVVHISTNTYVKGAEISLQIPLKYSADGVQSAKQLRVDSYGKVHTDGVTGTPVADTYVISMTAGDTVLHVGPDILGDIDTALSIYMPASDLMDVQVNLHWLNDSDEIKAALSDTSVRGNATALIGSEALVGNTLGKQSDDDEKAGGIGTSVVAMNFADANGSVGTIASSYTDSDGITKRLSNDSVDVQLRTKNGVPDLWTDAKDEAGENNVVTYMMFNVPRFGHPTEYVYDNKGNIIDVSDLVDGVVPRYYYVEDIVNVPEGYTAYNIFNEAADGLNKLQKTVGTDADNSLTYNNPLYYAYVITPPSDWNSETKAIYTIDCYVGLDITSIKMTVEHYLEKLTGDGYTPVEDKKYELESTSSSYEPALQMYSPEVNEYAGYDSPERQSIKVTVTGDNTVKYYYDLHYYDITVDTDGGEWFEEQEDCSWISVDEPPKQYTILTPTFDIPRPDKVGYTFDGYEGTGLDQPSKDVAIKKGSTGDRSYKALWSAQAYDIDVPVSLIYTMGWDGHMVGTFDQDGNNVVTQTGYIQNNSLFPVQVNDIKYDNDSVFNITAEKNGGENTMNWRLDASNNRAVADYWASDLQNHVNTSEDIAYWMKQNGEGIVTLDSDQAWYSGSTVDVKDGVKIGNIVWTFGIGARSMDVDKADYTVTLSYDANGGTDAPAEQSHNVTYPNTSCRFTISNSKPIRKGYTFAGWYTDSVDGDFVEGNYTVGKTGTQGNQSVVLYAHWTPNKYQNIITYDANGGTGAPEDQVKDIVFPDTVTTFDIPDAEPQRTGYAFDGWYTDLVGGEKVEGTYVVGESDKDDGTTVTLYAHWRQLLYSVTFNANTGNGTMNDMQMIYDVPSDLTLSSFTKHYCDFIGWNTDPYGEGDWYEDAVISSKYNGTDNISDGATVSNLTNPDVESTVTLYAQWKVNDDYKKWIYMVPKDGYYKVLVVGEAGGDAHYKHYDFDGDDNVYEIWDGESGSYQEAVYYLTHGTLLWCIPDDSELAGQTGAQYYCYGDMTNGVVAIQETGDVDDSAVEELK